MAESFDIVFHGKDKSECTDFIRAVRKYAKQNKKIRDTIWIADELYDAFDGEALGWYVRLPLNVREDWELLQQALAARWIPEVEPPTPANVSSPASPPNSAFSGTSTQSGTVGRVRMQVKGKLEARFLSKDVGKKGDPGSLGHRLGIFGVTTDAAIAMKVRFIVAGCNSHRLELVEHDSNLSVLAAFTYSNNDWNATNCWGYFVGVDAPGQGPLKDHRTTYNGPDNCNARQFWTERWQLQSTGRLKLHGSGNTADVASFALGNHNDNKDILWFRGPKTPSDPSMVDMDLEFEPL